jgi:hypothetical protein
LIFGIEIKPRYLRLIVTVSHLLALHFVDDVRPENFPSLNLVVAACMSKQMHRGQALREQGSYFFSSGDRVTSSATRATVFPAASLTTQKLHRRPRNCTFLIAALA